MLHSGKVLAVLCCQVSAPAVTPATAACTPAAATTTAAAAHNLCAVQGRSCTCRPANIRNRSDGRRDRCQSREHEGWRTHANVRLAKVAGQVNQASKRQPRAAAHLGCGSGTQPSWPARAHSLTPHRPIIQSCMPCHTKSAHAVTAWCLLASTHSPATRPGAAQCSVLLPLLLLNQFSIRRLLSASPLWCAAKAAAS